MTAEATAGLENSALAIAAAGPRPWSLPRPDWRPLLLGLGLPVAAALAWEALVRSGLATGRLLPPPSRIAVTLWKLARTGELWPHVGATSGRVGLGFVLGGVAGILSGLAASYSPLFRRLVDPTLQGLRAIPSLAWVPLFLLWLGIFETSKVALIAVGVFFPVYLGVMGAVLGVDRKLVEVGRIHRLSGLDLARRILLPAILPALVVALRTGLGLGWMFVVAAEYMGASEGIGYLLVDGQQLGKPDQIIAAILVFALLGKVADAAIVALATPALRWQDAYQGGR
ncbi:ABC transporter permease [Azospirillum sp. B4]|uniref:ABC transporter permease n=1 Tax=Azospirillum sp. B4 TaxID=95605 RepID=UPI00034642C4|nr:ABC transporter permease [Azospirillum sp. B4]